MQDMIATQVSSLLEVNMLVCTYKCEAFQNYGVCTMESHDRREYHLVGLNGRRPRITNQPPTGIGQSRRVSTLTRLTVTTP